MKFSRLGHFSLAFGQWVNRRMGKRGCVVTYTNLLSLNILHQHFRKIQVLQKSERDESLREDQG